MELTLLIAATIIAILLVLWSGELIARRQADRRADMLRHHLDEAITIQLNQYEKIEDLTTALRSALYERNAANVRAKRTASAVMQLPPMTMRSPSGVAVETMFSIN